MLAFICSLAAASAAPAAAPAVDVVAVSQRPILGGQRPADIDSPEVLAAAAAAAATVDATVERVTSATSQVVAGTYYRFTFTTTDGRTYAAEVVRMLNREYNVRSVEEMGDTGTNEAPEDDSQPASEPERS